MKTVGIAMLFGLCTWIGIRLGAKKTARLMTVRALRSDLQLFSEQIAAGNGTLIDLASGRDGVLFDVLRIYLDALSKGESETEAARKAIASTSGCQTVQAGLQMFLTGLSNAARSDLMRRIQTFSPMLERAESEAETDAKQARVLRISGVLAGAGLAILLL